MIASNAMVGWADLINTIGKSSPLLSGALSIPGAEMIGQTVASVFGGNITDPAALALIIQNDPESTLKLAQIEMSMRSQLQEIATLSLHNVLTAKKIAFERESIEIETARLDAQTARASKMPAFVSSAVIIGFYVVLCFIFFSPSTNQQILNIVFFLCGGLMTSFRDTVTFWLTPKIVKDPAQAEAAKAQADAVKTTAEAAKSTAEAAHATTEIVKSAVENKKE